MKYTKTIFASLILAFFAFAQTAEAAPFSYTHTSDSDFNGGTNNQTAVSGTGTPASVVLGQPFICGTSTVSYNGYAYPTVLIGTQCWLAENLQTTQKPDGSALTSYCYTGTGCASPWGRLYNWNTAMNGAGTATGCGAKIRGICPAGWHIPSDYAGCTTTDDFYVLSTFLGGDSVSGGHMKEAGTAHWGSGNTGDNISGFTGVGAGIWIPSTFYDRPNFGYFWTSFQYNAPNARFYLLRFNSAIFSGGNADKMDGFSVRCVKDDNPTYYSSGTYTSGYLDGVRAGVLWDSLSWQTIQQANTAIVLKAKTYSSPQSIGQLNTDFPSCTALATVSLGGGNSNGTVSLIGNNCVGNQQYLYYQAYITTPSPYATTPTLDQIDVGYGFRDASLTGVLQFIGSVIFQ